MRKLLVLILFLVTLSSFSQSVTENWNSILERYDYFDSSNSLIGYKKYSHIYKRWEYYDLRNTNNSNEYKIQQPRPDRTTAVLANVASSLQRKYDYNNRRIIQFYDKYIAIAEYALSNARTKCEIETDQDILGLVKASKREYLSKNYDLSNDNFTDKYINSEGNILKTYFEWRKGFISSCENK